MKKDIFRLIRNLILISVPLIVLTAYTRIFPENYMPEESMIWSEEKDYVNCSDLSADTVIIGDSRAKSAVIPAGLGDSVYNIGIGGATAIEDYYAADDYIKHHGAPANAIIIIGPFHLCRIDNWSPTLFNNYLSATELTEVYGNALRLHETAICNKGWFTDSLSYKLRLPNKYLETEYEAGFIKRYQANVSKFDSVRNDLGWCEYGSDNGCDGLDYETHIEGFNVLPIEDLYLRKLLDLLTENNVNIVYAQCPINRASADELSPGFTSGYTEYMNELKSDYPGGMFITSLPVYENRYFGDINHLNKAGASVYTAELKAYLEDIGFSW